MNGRIFYVVETSGCKRKAKEEGKKGPYECIFHVAQNSRMLKTNYSEKSGKKRDGIFTQGIRNMEAFFMWQIQQGVKEKANLARKQKNWRPFSPNQVLKKNIKSRTEKQKQWNHFHVAIGCKNKKTKKQSINRGSQVKKKL